jgi:hypothetical protein
MEHELERIKSVLDMCPTDDDKIAFLLRQVEWLLKTRDSYKEQLTQKEILKELEKISEKMARGFESQWTLKEIYRQILAMKR